MNGLLDVLKPQTAPEPKGARIVKGKCGRLGMNDPEERRRKDADALPPLTAMSGEFYRAYHAQKSREWRQRKRQGISLRPRQPKPLDIPTLSEHLAEKSLAHTRGVYRRR